MFEPEKSRFYLIIFDQFYLNCSGMCNVHYHKRDTGEKMNYSFNIVAAVTYRTD